MVALSSLPLRQGLQRCVRLLVLLCVCTYTVGCVDLSAIRSFAEVSAETAQYKKLVDDYSTYDQRVEVYIPSAHREALSKTRAERQLQRDQLIALQTAIVEYMRALGQLASDDLVSYDKELDGLAKAVGDAKWFDEPAVKAYGALAKVLARAVTDAWRQNELAQLIEETNAPLQELLRTLGARNAASFQESLRNEHAVIDKYFREIQADAGDGTPSAQIATVMAAERMERLTLREQAIRDYSAVLEKIAKGHQQLFDGKAKLSAVDVLRGVHQRALEIHAAFQAVRDLD